MSCLSMVREVELITQRVAINHNLALSQVLGYSGVPLVVLIHKSSKLFDSHVYLFCLDLNGLLS